MKKIDMKKMGETAMDGGLVLAGVVLGNFVINKVDGMINKDAEGTASTTEGIFGLGGVNVKKSIAPLVVGLGGLAIATMVDNKYAKPVGLGLIAIGGVKLVKGVSDKDLLAGDFETVTGIGSVSLGASELDDALKMIDRNLSGGVGSSEYTATEDTPPDYAGVGGSLVNTMEGFETY